MRQTLYSTCQMAERFAERSWGSGLTGLKAACASAIIQASVVGVSKAITV